MTIAIITVSYIAHIFLCRWILKKAYQFDKEESCTGSIVYVGFIPLIGLFVSCRAYIEEREYVNKKSWFEGKNW